MGLANSVSDAHRHSISCFTPCILVTLVVFSLAGCSNRRSPAPAQTAKVEPPSQIRVNVGADSVQITTPSAEFTVLPNGYVKAELKGTPSPLTLDDPGDSEGSAAAVSGKRIADFQLDLSGAQVSDAHGQLGTRGKRVEITGKSVSAPIGETLVVEAYDDFPNLVLLSNTFSNLGDAPVSLGKIDADSHRLNASLVDSKIAPYNMWSFEGASIRWGKDDIFEIPKPFSQKNQMGTLVEVKGDLGRVGGGVPVVAFWTRSVGEAIGHVETLPLSLAIPVDTASDGRVMADVQIEANTTLKHGEQYTTPHTFLAVYSGDFYEPLHMYSQVIAAEGLKQPKTTNEDYAVSWCGWGYLSDVTPKQMLDTIPKLKELGIHWATLDDRWFNNYGDWQPRADTFPGDAIQNMVKQFHEQGVKVQLWWLPLAVEDGGPGYEDHKYGVSEIVKEHPDWLILEKNGKPARMTRNLAALCPAVPGVQAYYKQLTERFIRDWGFDGSKLDNIYSVPMCFNPKHHHKSPMDSVYAMGDVYKTIFETTRALKPESVTQSCPCGTPPSIAWLRYLDQAVTADPVGSVQVRRRIKMYKALLGPEAAVYGDHVELTHVADVNGNERDSGQDFASTLGTGGVLGTKFTWPDDAPKYRDVYLTPEKEEHWKKWIGLYNEKMLSRGTFMNLYVYGFDTPEGYAIEKDGAMYYAFFAPATSAQQDSPPAKEWSGEIQLRGLAPGKYHVVDYVNGKDFGTVTVPDGRLKASFDEHLLLEVTKE